MASIEDKIREAQQELAGKLRQLPPIIGEEVVNFALDNFQREAWQSSGAHPWQKRKNPTKWGKKDEEGRALLVKTGKLKRSIRVGAIRDDKVSIIAGGADVPYAKAHNEGFQGLVHQHVREHFRTTRQMKNIRVKAHDRTIFQNIPKRQFIGNWNESPELAERINQAIREVLNQKL